jgi:hypothetical protein
MLPLYLWHFTAQQGGDCRDVHYEACLPDPVEALIGVALLRCPRVIANVAVVLSKAVGCRAAGCIRVRVEGTAGCTWNFANL